jgi:excisionase family DNA binding protein
MTIPAYAEPFDGGLPSVDERAAANQLRQLIAAHAAGDAKLRVLDDDKKPSEITLTPGLSQVLMELLRHVGSGQAVTLVPVGEMLTTQQAADILNVSRPFLISLLEREEIPHSLVGRHRRIKAEDLFAYKKKRDATRSEALSALAAEDADYL